MNYFNVLPIEAAIRQYGKRPILAVSSSEDERSVEAVTRLKELAGGKIIDKMYDNAGHGTEILSAGVGLESLILDFFSKNL